MSALQLSLKLANRLLNAAVAAVAALYLLTLVGLLLLRYLLLPHLDQLQPWLQRSASQAVGLPVRIGSVQGRWVGLLPDFTLNQLEIDDPQGRPALQLARVQAVPSWKSLLRLQPSFEQLVIDGAKLEVSRPDPGHLRVGGLLLALGGSGRAGTGALADWVFEQDQILLRNASVRWLDSSRGAPAVQLSDVNLELRNSPHRHRFALRAQTPDGLGGQVELRGDLHQSWLSRHPGDVAAWHGQLWAELPQLDWGQLARQLPLPAQLQAGHGQLRAWLTLGTKLQPLQLTVAGELRDSVWQLLPQQPALAVSRVSGSVGVTRLRDGWRLQLGSLQLRAAGPLQLDPLSLDMRWQQAPGQGSRGALASSAVDLGQLDALLRQLPLPADWRRRLQPWQLHGHIDTLRASWEQARGGALPRRYQIDTRFSGLGWSGLPGVLPAAEGWSGRLRADQDGGSASLGVHAGWLSVPTVFDSPRLPLQQLDTDFSWSHDRSGQWTLRSQRLQLANADAAGNASLRYTSAATGPGSLELSGRLTRADARAVPRYLPVTIPAATRDYLRSAIAGGQSDDVRFTVRGPLADFPFDRRHTGVFRISARIADGVFSIAPRQLLAPGQRENPQHAAANADWPVFSAIDGLLEFDGSGMHVHGARAQVFGSTVRNVNLDLPDYAQAVLSASGQADIATPDALHYLRASPLGAMLGHAFDGASGSGRVGLNLQLKLPLAHPDQCQVHGQLQLHAGELQLWPQLPPFQGVSGPVEFSESTFRMQLAAQDFLGGPLHLDGGRRGPSQPMLLTGNGLLRAATLPARPALAAWRPLLQHLSGQARYTLSVQLAPGAEIPRFDLRSNLQGLQVDLPTPLDKPAAASLPLQLSLAAAASGRSQCQLLYGSALHGQLLIDRASASLVAGRVAIGAVAQQALPAHGLQLAVQLPELDLDAWQRAIGDAGAGAAAALQPSAVQLRVDQLQASGYRLDGVVLDATRVGDLWQAKVRSRQLGGRLTWLMASGEDPGGIIARLDHLVVPREAADAGGTAGAAAASRDQTLRKLPALDLIANDVDLRGLPVKRLELKARNRWREGQREWDIDSFKLALPHASLSGSGAWSGDDGAQRMAIGFKLAIEDAGGLLAELGKPGLIKGGKGQLSGTVSWPGSPLSPQFSALSGEFNLALGRGQFLKADPGLAKLLGVLSLQSLPRRLLFNFSDVFESGFAFDDMGADVAMRDGVATTHNFRMRGVSAAVFLDGWADLGKETQDVDVVVVPEINAGSASLAYSLINPAIGLGSFLAQLVARKPLIEAFTYGYHVSGSWAHPRVVQTRGKPPSPGASAPAAQALPPAAAPH